jgi:hypothetical protein
MRAMLCSHFASRQGRIIMKKFALIASSVVLGLATLSQAALIASDNASNAVYTGGNYDGLNGGSGFQPWLVSPATNGSNNGAFVGTSSTNAFGTTTPNIDTGTPGRAFGLYANGGQNAVAIRGLTGALDPGQGIRYTFDNGFIDTNQQVVAELRSGVNNRLRLQFTGGVSPSYELVDNSGVVATGLAFTGEGLRVDFSLLTANTYSITIARQAGGTPPVYVGTGTLANSGGIDNIRFANLNAGGGGARDAFINSLAVVPEPTTLAGVAGVALLALRRRK